MCTQQQKLSEKNQRRGNAFSATFAVLVGVTLGLTAGIEAINSRAVAQNNAALGELPGANEPYPFLSIGQDIVQTLKYFGQNINVSVSIDKGVSGKVLDMAHKAKQSANSSISPPSRLTYLTRLGRDHDFVWFYDGVVLYVSSLDTIETKAIALKNNGGSDVMRLLEELRIIQPKFLHRIDKKNAVMIVTGPNKYTELVAKVVASIEEGKRIDLSVLRGETIATLGGGVNFPSGGSGTRLLAPKSSPASSASSISGSN